MNEVNFCHDLFIVKMLKNYVIKTKQSFLSDTTNFLIKIRYKILHEREIKTNSTRWASPLSRASSFIWTAPKR